MLEVALGHFGSGAINGMLGKTEDLPVAEDHLGVAVVFENLSTTTLGVSGHRTTLGCRDVLLRGNGTPAGRPWDGGGLHPRKKLP